MNIVVFQKAYTLISSIVASSSGLFQYFDFVIKIIEHINNINNTFMKWSLLIQVPAKCSGL